MLLSCEHGLGWQQLEWHASPSVGSFARFGKVIQPAAALLFQNTDNLHDSFDETTTGLALRAETAIASEYAGMDLSLGQGMGRFNPLDICKCPQSVFSLENISASTRATRMSVAGALV